MTKSKSSISNFPVNNTMDERLLDQMLQDAHGEVPYNMTNDYMFRAVLQSNNKVLRGLICSLLHLEESEVQSVEITNPVILGEAIDDKEIRLDINVRLNNKSMINLEMQVANKLNWQNRSLIYLSRSFDNLNRGHDYLDVQPAIHIGFLDYTLFQEQPEFYATYKLMNMKNHNIYSDNFVLSVVDLSRIDLATGEDKKYYIDAWAKLFKATTWEEIKKMAATNEYLQEASKSIFQFNTDEQMRKLCRDRVEYYQDLHNYERAITQKDTVIAELQGTITDLHGTIAEQNATIADLRRTIAEQNATITDLRNTIAEQNTTITDLRDTIAEQNATLAGLTDTITDQSTVISGQNVRVTDLHSAIDKLNTVGTQQYSVISDLHAMVQRLLDEQEKNKK